MNKVELLGKWYDKYSVVFDSVIEKLERYESKGNKDDEIFFCYSDVWANPDYWKGADYIGIGTDKKNNRDIVVGMRLTNVCGIELALTKAQTESLAEYAKNFDLYDWEFRYKDTPASELDGYEIFKIEGSTIIVRKKKQ